jgi:hypothetical protein
VFPRVLLYSAGPQFREPFDCPSYKPTYITQREYVIQEIIMRGLTDCFKSPQAGFELQSLTPSNLYFPVQSGSFVLGILL